VLTVGQTSESATVAENPAGELLQLYVYGGVPPLPVGEPPIVTHAREHICVAEPAWAMTGVFTVTVAEDEAVQAKLVVMVTV